MHLVLIAVLIILLVAYIWSNLKYNTTYQILQLKPEQLTHTVLAERNPIVVEGKHVHQVLEGAMRSMYFSKKLRTIGESQMLYQNGARFAVFFHNEDTKAIVEILTPMHAKLKPEDDQYQSVSVVLDKNHLLILPLFWSFRVSGTRVAAVMAHDLPSLMHDFFKFSVSSRPR